MGKRKVTISSELFVIFYALSPIQFWLVCCFYEINDVLWDKKLLKRISAAPNITFISPKQVIVQGDKVTLICQADGRPSPTISWSKRMSDGDQVNASFWITGKHDNRKCMCIASNGMESLDAALTTLDVQCEFRRFITPLLTLLLVDSIEGYKLIAFEEILRPSIKENIDQLLRNP